MDLSLQLWYHSISIYEEFLLWTICCYAFDNYQIHIPNSRGFCRNLSVYGENWIQYLAHTASSIYATVVPLPVCFLALLSFSLELPEILEGNVVKEACRGWPRVRAWVCKPWLTLAIQTLASLYSYVFLAKLSIYWGKVVLLDPPWKLFPSGNEDFLPCLADCS